MLSIIILCVGKLKERFFADAAAEYIKRLAPLCKLQIREIPEQKAGNADRSDIRAALQKQGSLLLQAIPDHCRVIALCIEGSLLSSQSLADYIESCAGMGESSLCFIIGGSDGLDERVKQRAHLRLSMSPMTFPHHLARIMLLEQLYRAFMIRGGSKYHTPA